MDDPLKILRKAEIECPEAEAYAAERESRYASVTSDIGLEYADPVILALAKLAAKLKWQRGAVIGDWTSQEGPGFANVADLDARWEARDA
jgi:hypothetical protein